MSFSISITTKYTVAVSCRFASISNVYKVYYCQCTYNDSHRLILTNYITNI